jgi:hypothetical protein
VRPARLRPLRHHPMTGPCQECGQPHVTHTGTPACSGHVVYDRDSYEPGQLRPPLPEPRPCKRAPTRGLTVCNSHGARAPHVKAAGQARHAEAQAAAAARKLIPDLADRAAITNPLETLLELASEANAFRESLRVMANSLDGRIRYAAGAGSGEQLRAEVAVYRQALKDTTDLLVAIARLDIEKTLARVTLAQAEQALASLRAGMDEAGLSDEQKRTVMTGAGRHLRAVAG